MTRARDVANIDGLLTTTGDTYYASAAGTPARLGIGTTGQVLKVSGGLPSWGTDVGGKLLQVVQGTYATQTASSSSSYADTGLTATITPTLATSKVLVMYCISWRKDTQNSQNAVNFQLLRDATSISIRQSMGYTGTAIQNYGYVGSNVLDTPATTSATTYKVRFASDNNSAAVNVHGSGDISTIILMEIGA
jgi:hypothetical protein